MKKNNEELLQKKRNYGVTFIQVSLRKCALIAAYGGTFFGLLVGMKSMYMSLDAYAAISAAPRIASFLDKTINPAGLGKLHDILTCNIIKSVVGFMAFRTGLLMADGIHSIEDHIEQDASIDALIEKNQSIIAKLKEIKQTA